MAKEIDINFLPTLRQEKIKVEQCDIFKELLTFFFSGNDSINIFVFIEILILEIIFFYFLGLCKLMLIFLEDFIIQTRFLEIPSMFNKTRCCSQIQIWKICYMSRPQLLKGMFFNVNLKASHTDIWSMKVNQKFWSKQFYQLHIPSNWFDEKQIELFFPEM